MKQTNKYKLNLIETSDPFGPEALNENTQKLEDALEAKGADLSAHAADKTQHALVKLGRVEVPAGTTQTLSVTNPTDYTMFIIDVNVKAKASETFYIRANGSSGGYVNANPNGSIMHGICVLTNANSIMGGISFSMHNTPNLIPNFSAYLTGVAWSTLHTLGFVGNDADAVVTVYALRA